MGNEQFTAVDGNECPVCGEASDRKVAVIAPSDAFVCQNDPCPVFKFFGGAVG